MCINRSRLRVSLALGILLALLALGMAPCRAESDAKRIEGSWMGTLTPTDPPFGAFTDMLTLIPKGGVVESRRFYVPEAVFGPILATASHGAWQKVGHREFQIRLVSLVQGAPDNATAKGVELATDTINLRVELNEAGTELHGFFEDEVKDLEGTVVFTAVGTYHATRIRAESGRPVDDKPGAKAD